MTDKDKPIGRIESVETDADGQQHVVAELRLGDVLPGISEADALWVLAGEAKQLGITLRELLARKMGATATADTETGE